MKRKLIMAVFVVLGTTMLTAQERDRDQIRDQDRTKLVMVNGAMLEVREQAQKRLKDKQQLEDGTVLSPDGKYVTKDGQQMQLQEGECLDSDGIKYRNEYQYRRKIQEGTQGLTEAEIRERNRNRVHYTLVDGEMYVVRTQAQEQLQKQLDLGKGVIVDTDGNYEIRNMKQLRLQEGECINLDGEMFRNTLQHRKMMVQKNKMKGKKGMKKKPLKKPSVQKKKKSTQ
ncbi:hypothetical protein FK220_009840 [Flavobacteriaceae bacterium TP-CH-4]|uniref:DUF6799 domain-containing protein n=1 Tax=Pelagihabitans pacificus TaxID=2696054 RepID=A0A967E5P6_9FLAO|nr:DUF6799 domain-containing protein [Pelagihabitans pacificus]NHF59642.1 hypothetical protein [Pelagihabitans pacificus]